MMRHFQVFLVLVPIALLGAACNPTNTQIAAATGPQSWIDAPLDGSAVPPGPCAVPPGPCVEVVSHSADPLRIVQVELSVNGAVVQTSPNSNPNATLALTRQTWTPPSPGNYTLMVRAQNSAGAWGDYAQAVVTIPGETAPPKTSPVAPPPLVVVTPTATTKPGAPVPSPLPVVSITFYADATTLAQGQCTTIHWQVTNASKVLLDGAVVAAAGTKQACPNQTATHSLNITTLDNQQVSRTITITVVPPTVTPVPPPPSPTPPPAGCTGTPNIASFSASPTTISAGGSSTLSWGAVTNADSVSIDQGIGGVATPGSRSVSPASTTTYTLTARCGSNLATRQVTVVVTAPTSPPTPPPSPPADTTGPTITSLVPSNTTFYRTGACNPKSVTVTANVSDPSGVSSVQLWYRVGTSGSFTGPVNMASIGGNNYSVIVNGSSVPGSSTGVWQFYLTARDSRGNTSTSATNSSVSLLPPCVA